MNDDAQLSLFDFEPRTVIAPDVATDDDARATLMSVINANGHAEPLLFSEDDLRPDWEAEWQGMPEFKMGNTEPCQKITVNFQTFEDVRAFADLVGQRVTNKTDSIWYPAQGDYIAPRAFRYIDSGDES